MKKALLKDSFFEIRRSAGRFISIMLIVMLGVAFFAGLRAAGPDMYATADDFFDANNLMDIHLISTMGFNENDINAIKESNYAQTVDAEYSYDVLLHHAQEDVVIKLMSITEGGLNGLVVKEGRMPKGDKECVVLEGKALSTQINIGDKVTYKSGTDDDITEVLKNDTFTVVGIVNSPYFISLKYGSSTIGSGSVNGVMFINDECFDLDVYTDLYVAVKGAKELSCFSDEYDKLIKSAKDEFDNIADVRESERYDEIISEANEKIEDGQKELDDAKTEADEELSSAKAELDDAQNKIDKADKQLSDGKRELATKKREAASGFADAEKQIAALKKQYDSGLKQYNDGKAEIEKNEKVLNAAKIELAKGEKELEKAKTQLQEINIKTEQLENTHSANEQSIAYLQAALENPALTEEERNSILANIYALQVADNQIAVAIDELKTGKIAIEEGISEGKAKQKTAKEQISAGEAELKAAKNELFSAKAGLSQLSGGISSAETTLKEKRAEAETEFNNAEAKLDNAEKELSSAKTEFEDGKEEYENAKKEAEDKIADSQKEIDESREKLKELSEPTWYSYDRKDATFGYSDYVDAADRMDAMAKIFPLIFIIVAALVSLNAMTRMVEEQRTLIGTLKGLGYSNASIAGKYMIYAAAASIIGSVVGVSVGIRVFPLVIYSAYCMMFIMPSLMIGFYPATAVTAAVVSVLVTTLAALFACSASLRSEPAKLMRPKAPKTGKRVFLERIGFIWRHLSFTKKVTVRNLFRYKKRFIMTVFGIGASVMLLLVGFGIRDSVNNILHYQYEDIYNYDLLVNVNGGDIDKVENNMLKIDGVEEASQAFMRSIDISSDSASGRISAVITAFNNDKDLEGYIKLQDRLTKEKYVLEDDEIIITEKMSMMLGVGVGDKIILHDGTNEIEATVSAITEHYAMHFVYMTYNTYKEYFSEECEPNSIFAHMSENYDSDTVGREILKNDEVVGISFTNDIMDTFADMLSALNYVVLVLIFSAGALSLLILYNLTNINVSERYREIATIKVLGFYDGEVLSYVYRENFILTAIAIIFGIAGGYFLHGYIIRTVEVSAVMFGRAIEPVSYLFAVILTAAFALIVNFIMYFKLKKIDMVEALKSVE